MIDDFKYNLIKQCCNFSNDVYDKKQFSKQFKYICDSATDTEVAFDIVNDKLFFIFTGTESFHDIVTDSLCNQVQFIVDNNFNIEVHRGFYNAYNSVKSELFNLLIDKSQYKKIKDIIITGHSLGAALAVLFSIDFVYNLMDNNCIGRNFYCDKKLYTVTFGQPKIGNSEFCNSANKLLQNNYYRIVNGKDIVTKVPFVNYEHCGELIQIGDESFYNFNILEDHRIKNYLNNLNK